MATVEGDCCIQRTHADVSHWECLHTVKEQSVRGHSSMCRSTGVSVFSRQSSARGQTRRRLDGVLLDLLVVSLEIRTKPVSIALFSVQCCLPRRRTHENRSVDQHGAAKPHRCKDNLECPTTWVAHSCSVVPNSDQRGPKRR